MATLNYLTGSGWPEYHIIEPADSHNTLEETRSALAIVRMHQTEEVTVVSSWYHVPRIWLIWRLLRFKGKIIFGASAETENLPGSVTWEIAGFAKLFFKIAARRV
jgi:uncharacterized SAM-binding protein YcdF (DUF218 family)